jgi:hypothetical protein
MATCVLEFLRLSKVGENENKNKREEKEKLKKARDQGRR